MNFNFIYKDYLLGIIIDEMIIYCVQLILPKNYYHNRDCEK